MRILYLKSFIILFVVLSLTNEFQAFKLINKKIKRDSNSHDNHQVGDHPVKHWGYRNEDKSLLPKNWHKSHPQCYGKQQSPINVESSLTEFDDKLTELKISEIYVVNNQTSDENVDKETWEVKNNGHSVVLYPVNRRFSFMMQPENSKYKLLQMHFHWRGSEHYVDGHKFAAELHLVHQNAEDEKKFAVLGFLISQTNSENPKLNPIVNVLPNIINYGAKNKTNLRLESLIPFDLKNYFRYSGSLTTPDCDEIVEWFVIDSPVLTISDEQILDFQTIEDKNGYPVLTNSRPIQDLHGRAVKRSFEIKDEPLKRKTLQSASGYTENAGSQLKTSFNLIALLSILMSVYFSK